MRYAISNVLTTSIIHFCQTSMEDGRLWVMAPVARITRSTGGGAMTHGKHMLFRHSIFLVDGKDQGRMCVHIQRRVEKIWFVGCVENVYIYNLNYNYTIPCSDAGSFFGKALEYILRAKVSVRICHIKHVMCHRAMWRVMIFAAVKCNVEMSRTLR